MRIVLVSADFHPNAGGIAAHVVDLANGLARRGEDVTVIGGHLSHAQRRAPLENLGFALHLRENGGGVHGGPRALSAPRSALEHAGWVRWARLRLREVCAARVPDVVHWHTPFYDPLVARAAPAQVARVFTNHRSDVFELLRSPPWRALLGRLNREADVVLAPSPDRAERSPLLGIDARRCHFVPNGIDVARFEGQARSSALAAELGVQDGDRVIIVVARPVPVKGLSFALAALPAIVREHPRAKLLMVGGDASPHQRELEQQAHALGVDAQVIWAGERPNAQLPAFYALATLALVPSLSEGMSIAALEAMASGLPVVATRVGGTPEIVVDGQTGTLVPAGDAAAIGAAVSRLLREDGLRQRYGRAAHARVAERYTIDAMLDAVLEHYREAIAHRAGR